MAKNEYLELLGKRIRVIRKELGLYQMDFEDQVGIGRGSLLRLEAGKGGSITNILKILNFLMDKGYNCEWIIKMDNSGSFKKDDPLRFYTFPKEDLVEQAKKLNQLTSEHLETLEKLEII